MAIADRYRNRLTTAKKNNALQTNTTGLQSGTQNGLQDNTTNVENTEQNTEQNTSNNYWLNLASRLNGAVNKGIGYVTDSIKNNINDAVNSVNNKNAVNNLKYQDYANLINAKTANPKMELQSALQRAQSASNAYLKALGLQGSGMGQSQLTDIGVQYQNALSKINQTAQDDVNNQLAKDLEDAVSNGRYSARDAQDFIRQYGEQTGNTELYKNIAENYGATYEQEAENVFNNLKDIIDNKTYELVDKSTVNVTPGQKLYATQLRNKLNEAYSSGNQEEFYNILDENVDFLQNLKTPENDISNGNDYENVIDKSYTSSSEEAFRFELNLIKENTTYKYRGNNGNEVYVKKLPLVNGERKFVCTVNGKEYETDFNGVLDALYH